MKPKDAVKRLLDLMDKCEKKVERQALKEAILALVEEVEPEVQMIEPDGSGTGITWPPYTFINEFVDITHPSYTVDAPPGPFRHWTDSWDPETRTYCAFGPYDNADAAMLVS